MLGLIINPFVEFPVTAASPLDYPNLWAWFKADTYALANGTAVGGTGKEWVDQSGNGRDLTQPTSGQQPIFNTNQQNSLPGINFPFVFPFRNFIMPLLALGVNGSFTFLIVENPLTSDGILLGNSTTNEQARERVSTLRFQVPGQPAQDSSALSSGTSAARLAVFRRNGDALTFKENNTSRSGSTYGFAFNLNEVGDTTNLFSGFAGTICEIVLYTGFVADADLTTLYDNYFKPKWGLP